MSGSSVSPAMNSADASSLETSKGWKSEPDGHFTPVRQSGFVFCPGVLRQRAYPRGDEALLCAGNEGDGTAYREPPPVVVASLTQGAAASYLVVGALQGDCLCMINKILSCCYPHGSSIPIDNIIVLIMIYRNTHINLCHVLAGIDIFTFFLLFASVDIFPCSSLDQFKHSSLPIQHKGFKVILSYNSRIN